MWYEFSLFLILILSIPIHATKFRNLNYQSSTVKVSPTYNRILTRTEGDTEREKGGNKKVSNSFSCFWNLCKWHLWWRVSNSEKQINLCYEKKSKSELPSLSPPCFLLPCPGQNTAGKPPTSSEKTYSRKINSKTGKHPGPLRRG